MSDNKEPQDDSQNHNEAPAQVRNSVTHKGYEIREDKDGNPRYKLLARQVAHKKGGGHRIHLDAIPFSGKLDFFPAEKRLDGLRQSNAQNRGKDKRQRGSSNTSQEKAQDHERE